MSTIDGCPSGGILGSLTGYTLFEVVVGGVTGSAKDGDTTETDTFECMTNAKASDEEPVECCKVEEVCGIKVPMLFYC